MDVNGPVLEQLSRGECLRLMGLVPVGRIVYTRQALPAVELVNFALDGGGIVIRTDAGGKLAAATRGAVVAFEADSVDVAGHGGWSVTVIGHATAVTDRAEVARLERLPLTSWAPGNRDHFIRDLPGDRERAADRGRAGAGGRRCGSLLSAGSRWCPAVRAERAGRPRYLPCQPSLPTRIATTSRSARSGASRVKARPIRPKPLIPTLVVMVPPPHGYFSIWTPLPARA